MSNGGQFCAKNDQVYLYAPDGLVVLLKEKGFHSFLKEISSILLILLILLILIKIKTL